MIVNLPTEHHFEFLSLTGGCTGSSEYTHVKMPHCWKSHALAHYYYASYNSTTLVNVYVDLVVFTRIAGTSKTGSGRYWC